MTSVSKSFRFLQVKLKKKQRKVDHEVADLRARLSGNSVKPIVLSNREIRLLRYIELTEEEIAKIEGSPKVAKKLERLRSHGKEDEEEGEEDEDGDEDDSEESDTASQPRSGEFWSYISDEPSSLTAASHTTTEPVSLSINNNLDSIGSNLSNLSNSSSGCCCQCHHNGGAGIGGGGGVGGGVIGGVGIGVAVTVGAGPVVGNRSAGKERVKPTLEISPPPSAAPVENNNSSTCNSPKILNGNQEKPSSPGCTVDEGTQTLSTGQFPFVHFRFSILSRVTFS